MSMILFYSIQLSLRNFGFDWTHDSQYLCKNWFQSIRDSKWFSGIRFKSTHDWEQLSEFWLKSTYDTKKKSQDLDSIQLMIQWCFPFISFLVSFDFLEASNITVDFVWPFWGGGATRWSVDFLWPFLGFRLGCFPDKLIWISSWLKLDLGYPWKSYWSTYDSKCFPIFQFQSTRNSSKKYLILSRLMIQLRIIPMSGCYTK